MTGHVNLCIFKSFLVKFSFGSLLGLRIIMEIDFFNVCNFYDLCIFFSNFSLQTLHLKSRGKLRKILLILQARLPRRLGRDPGHPCPRVIPHHRNHIEYLRRRVLRQ